jgi:hypothetical protein
VVTGILDSIEGQRGGFDMPHSGLSTTPLTTSIPEYRNDASLVPLTQDQPFANEHEQTQAQAIAYGLL